MAGRKPKQGVTRSKSGRIAYRDRGETETQILGTVLAYRKRTPGLKEADIRDQRAGYALGRLALMGVEGGGISKLQHDAGIRYGELVARFSRVMGLPRHTPRSSGVIHSAGGISCAPELDEKAIMAVRRDYADAFGELRDLEIKLGMRDVCFTVAEVCVRDREIPRGNEPIGALRSGLNVLARMWGMH